MENDLVERLELKSDNKVKFRVYKMVRVKKWQEGKGQKMFRVSLELVSGKKVKVKVYRIVKVRVYRMVKVKMYYKVRVRVCSMVRVSKQ